MIEPPPVVVSKTSSLVDWLEITTTVETSGTLSVFQAADVINDCGWLGTGDRPFFPEDETVLNEAQESSDEEVEQVVRDAMSIIKQRRDSLGRQYPLVVKGDIIERQVDHWREVVAFLSMSLMSMAMEFSDAHTVLNSGSSPRSFRTLFEKIVEASARARFGGTTVRFGTPADDGWPADIKSRVEELARRFDVDVQNLSQALGSHDNDRTLDIASRLNLGDDGAGSVIFVLQCATGRNWQSKASEPTLGMFEDLLQWDGELIRGVAIPLWLENPKRYRDVWRRFDKAMVLDRRRLMVADLETNLDADVKVELCDWVEAQLAALPAL